MLERIRDENMSSLIQECKGNLSTSALRDARSRQAGRQLGPYQKFRVLKSWDCQVENPPPRFRMRTLPFSRSSFQLLAPFVLRSIGDAATGDGEGRVAVQAGWRGAAVTLLCREAPGLACSRLVSTSLLEIGRVVRKRGPCGLLPRTSCCRGRATAHRDTSSGDSLRRGGPRWRSSSLLVHRDGVLAMDSG